MLSAWISPPAPVILTMPYMPAGTLIAVGDSVSAAEACPAIANKHIATHAMKSRPVREAAASVVYVFIGIFLMFSEANRQVSGTVNLQEPQIHCRGPSGVDRRFRNWKVNLPCYRHGYNPVPAHWQAAPRKDS